MGSQHWIFLMLQMSDKQIGIAHNSYLLSFVVKNKSITIQDLCYLLAARIEAGLLNKGISKTSLAILDRLFSFYSSSNTDIQSIADYIGCYLVENEYMDVVDRMIHSIAKYPHLIALNDEQHSFKIKPCHFALSQFLTYLLLSLERKLLIHRKSDGIMKLMTRITNNILLINNYYKKEANTKDSPLNIREWSQLFYYNFDRLTISEALILLQTLIKTEHNEINWSLITKLSFHQFNFYNLQQLNSLELTSLLQILMDIDKKTQKENVMTVSLIHNIENIISNQICQSPETLDGDEIKSLEMCLDYFNLNKTELLKAKDFFIEKHKYLTPHWSKFYKKRKGPNDEEEVILDKWWKKKDK